MGIENIDDLKPEDVKPAPSVPTTSPDVKIISDPGPAPEGDAPTDDDKLADEPGDPASDDEVISVLEEKPNA